MYFICICQSEYCIFEVPNWHLMMASNAVTICDRFEIAISEVIHVTQNKKPILFENRLQFDAKSVPILF